MTTSQRQGVYLGFDDDDDVCVYWIICVRVSHNGQARGCRQVSSEGGSIRRSNDEDVKGESELGHLYIYIYREPSNAIHTTITSVS